MSTKKSKPPRKPKPSKKLRYRAPSESKASEAITVAWTVSITTLFGCNLAVLAIHYWLKADPQAQSLAMLKELLLFAGAIVGVVSLVLLPAVYRLRSVSPPTGLAVFGACLAAAPLLTLFLRSLQ
ncbi:hypothetical protein [Bythopirellula polymerisocia]|nr:hypothetical protein [Bythopirellula polymerisocia]